jgi:hypothetical protein
MSSAPGIALNGAMSRPTSTDSYAAPMNDLPKVVFSPALHVHRPAAQ